VRRAAKRRGLRTIACGRATRVRAGCRYIMIARSVTVHAEPPGGYAAPLGVVNMFAGSRTVRKSSGGRRGEAMACNYTATTTLVLARTMPLHLVPDGYGL
jgi:hypothetical protein